MTAILIRWLLASPMGIGLLAARHALSIVANTLLAPALMAGAHFSFLGIHYLDQRRSAAERTIKYRMLEEFRLRRRDTWQGGPTSISPAKKLSRSIERSRPLFSVVRTM